MARFRAETYPGWRPEGPVLVHQGLVWPLRIDGPAGSPFGVDPVAAGAGVLAPGARWVLAYGSNACPDRLIDKGLDARGAILLPAVARGWAAAWEARRTTSTGAVPLTLVAAPGRQLDTWLLGLDRRDVANLDASEGRGHNYLLGRIGPVAVAARWLVEDALAYGPVANTRVLVHRDGAATHPLVEQAEARLLLADPATARVVADPLPGVVAGRWPATPLADLDLFVYGTLQPGQARFGAIADYVEVLGAASMPGTLVATRYGWPAARFGGSGRIHGALLRPRHAEAAVELLAVADDLEGAPELFRRVAVELESGPSAARTWAAAYEWSPSKGTPPGTVVPDGRWRA